MSNLVIVESPAKAKTIQKYLGNGFEVIASMGHIRDLPKSKLGVDIEHDFTPQYTEIKGKEDLIKELTREAKKSEKIYLATDPDREGEAISWHLANLLGLDLNAEDRVAFNEITKSGVQAGMANPRKINLDLVNAQQARRILDRIVGYKLSPFLWKKVRRGLSAGRVQSVAVRLIVDREKEIQNFKPQEYWSIDAKLAAPSGRKQFKAKFTGIGGKKVELPNEEKANEVLALCKDAEFVVTGVKKSVHRKSPAAPFTTSTMQQEASRRLGFQARRTMKAAQELYEGVDVGGELGSVGLITYMRTDSLRISDEAREAAYQFIQQKYGKDYLPPSPRVFKSKSNSQDAHEAIRPTMPHLTPDSIKTSLTTDQFKLYKLVWERFIASQMANALLNTVSVDILACQPGPGGYDPSKGDAASQFGEKGCNFKASGFSVKFDGFTVLYEEAKEENTEEEGASELPPLEKEDRLKVKTLDANQHFTQPPPRFSEASLIKTLEENGIGRPSTYAPTITTIINRLYVEREGKQLRPTGLGEVTTDLMKEHFKRIVDVKFTAGMESSLDEVELGKENWVNTLRQFYGDFDQTLTEAEKAMEGKRVKVPDEETDIVCELCGRNMVIKIGRFGKFLACPGFPECKNTKKIVQETGGKCPLCGKRILQKKSKKGKKYFGCEDNPTCGFMTWSTPVSDICPKCGSTLFQRGGKSGKLVCEKPGCGYERGLKNEE